MARGPKVDKEDLLQAGLQLMTKNGRPLKKVPSNGTSKIFSLPNGETVRARTCNDHIMIVIADKPHLDAKLNIEGTDWVMLTMPEIPRTPGPVVVYLLPTQKLINDARQSHGAWLKTHPKTNGQNTTWNLWFDGQGNPWDGYAKKWAEYRIPGTASADDTKTGSLADTGVEPSSSLLKDEISASRERIAKLAGVPIEAVKLSIDFAS
jgi:hypothetical protein